MARYFYIDERKSGDYLLGVVVVPDVARPATNRAVKSLLMPGQRSFHARKETEGRGRQALQLLAQMRRDHGVEVLVVNAGRSCSQVERRARAITGLADEWVDEDVVIFDRDKTLEARDRRTMVAATRAHGITTTYRHAEPTAELILGLADITAWAAGAGGGSWPSLLREVGARHIRA